jgi:hypothetical protein
VLATLIQPRGRIIGVHKIAEKPAVVAATSPSAADEPVDPRRSPPG